jgi:hypothetical protein
MGPFQQTLALRREAKVQGLSDVKVWDCQTACYSKRFLEQGGADVDKQFVDILYAPFFDARERKADKMVDNFVRFTGEDNVGELGAVYSFGAGLAFRNAVNAVVKQHGVNGLTRKNLLAALNNVHDFDADGLLAPIDLGGRKVTECHVLLQVQDGDFVRVHPKKPGTYDCSPRNVVETELDLLT